MFHFDAELERTHNLSAYGKLDVVLNPLELKIFIKLNMAWILLQWELYYCRIICDSAPPLHPNTF